MVSYFWPLWSVISGFAFQFRVVVEDSGCPSQSAIQDVTIFITRDKYPPVFENTPYKTFVDEDVNTGIEIFRITATDQDLVVSFSNLEFIYSFQNYTKKYYLCSITLAECRKLCFQELLKHFRIISKRILFSIVFKVIREGDELKHPSKPPFLY